MRYLPDSVGANSRAVLVFAALLFSSIIISFAYGHPMDENKSRQQLWEEVSQAQKQRLPKTEIGLLQRIYDQAVAEEAFPEAARALFQKIVVESKINQPAAPFAIKKLQSEKEKVPAKLKPITDAVLANWMFAFFQQNRWRFQQRSQTSTTVSADIQTWDLRRILQAIDRSLTDALSSAEDLKNIPVDQYAQLTRSGNAEGDLRRPTVFDFIAHQAIAFYALDEQIIRGIDDFQVTADSPIFSADREFLQWQPATDDVDSFALKTVKLYQQVMAFHQSDNDQTAYLAADLQRLAFANSIAKGPEKTARYRAALQRFADQNKQHPISSEALAQLARSHFSAGDQGDLVQAHRLATVGLNRFKDSVGGAACQNLIDTIEQPAATIATELIWNEAKPEFHVSYKNLQKITFRVVEFKRDLWPAGFRVYNRSKRQQRREQLLSMPVTRQWEVDLPPTEDFRMATQTISVPDDLKKGAYVVIGLLDDPKQNSDDVLFAEQVWRTDFAHILHHRYNAPVLKGQVLDGVTGQPVEGANVKIQMHQRNDRTRDLQDVANVTTDQNGIYSVKVQQRSRRHYITISKGDDNLFLLDNNHRRSMSDGRGVIARSSMFTDRSIYRPGQTIHFKVVCSDNNQRTGEYQVAPNEKLSVQLLDANHQLVETVELVTNEMGSAAGVFTAPQDRVTGRMQLKVDNSKYQGETLIRVEEYKRPKFKVDVDKPEKSYALNDAVTVTGHAMAYNGAPIDGAQVTYRVVRSVRYAPWWYWRCWWGPTNVPQQEIAQGTSETKTDGSFEINFDAIPDPDADREGQPAFTFTVYADVTDTSGETRSARTQINVGFVSLAATVSHDQWLTSADPTKFSVTTQTLDGIGQSATGKLIVRKLTPPKKVQRASILGNPHRYRRPQRNSAAADQSDFRRWKVGDVIYEKELTTDDKGVAEHSVPLEAGAFQVSFETTDDGGEKVLAESALLVIDPSAKTFVAKIPDYFAVKKNSLQPGETWTAVWGTGYESGAAYVEVFHLQQSVMAFWTNQGADEGSTQKQIEIAIEEKHRGGLNVVVTYVRENRMYTHQHKIHVPWKNKELDVKWEHFVSKLQPGGRETWTAVVSGRGAESSAIEMVAALYDSSLDQFARHQWANRIGAFYQDNLYRNQQFSNRSVYLDRLGNFKIPSRQGPTVSHRRFSDRIAFAHFRSLGSKSVYFGSQLNGVAGVRMRSSGVAADGAMDRAWLLQSRTGVKSQSGPVPTMAMAALEEADASAPAGYESTPQGGEGAGGAPGGPDLTQVSIRKNLQETAFFYPNLIADGDGKIKIEFEVPEALTTWKFMGLTHDADLRTGMLIDEMTTSKDLMVQPNPPRFLREGDQLYFSVKVTNQSDKPQTGVVQLQLNNAFDESPIDEAFRNSDNKKTFEVPPMQSRSYHWKLSVPDYVGAITYKVVGASDTVSDGEEGMLPVLSKRILVTESLPLPIRGNQTRTFTFAELEKMDRSDSLKNQSLTVQMTSNPSWYAVMALPYLMEYPHQCSEQTFNRLYANALGKKIVNSNPRIKNIFDQWRGTDALKSPLEKNDELRNVTIAESPWLLDGKNESQARRNVGLLFDENRINREVKKASGRLAQMQLSNGSWPWFDGGRPNEYLTLYITSGLGRLRKLGVDVDVSPAVKALNYLDADLKKRYDRIVNNDRLNSNNLDSTVALYLYGRSFFLEDMKIGDQNRVAYDYFVGQAKEYWPKLGSRQSQAHLAIALKRQGDSLTANAVMKSLTERSLRDDELGQYWTTGDRFWFWHQAPIETQALLIEAYDEVLGDAESVEECKIWLLKQKQTQAWKTTKSTADAVYALLLRGADNLASSKLVSVKIGGQPIQPEQVEAGTGFFQEKFTGGDINSNQKTVEVAKSDDGIAWGSVHWQYLEDVSKIEPYEGTPLTLKKRLFIKKNTDDGPEIAPVTGPVKIGDELVTRVEIRVDRDMEYVHLKDYRGSGTEPVNVLSRYRSQDGLWYYESTRDTATHFFIDYLRRGTYVFESSVRVQHAGKYQTGIAELQCMYAPEFNSHSGSVEIEVKPAE